MTTSTVVRLDKNLQRRAKAAAAIAGVSLTAWLDQAVLMRLQVEEKENK